MRRLQILDYSDAPMFSDDRLCISVQPRLIDSIVLEEREAANGDKYSFVPNDIALLVQQQKLSHFNSQDLQSIIDSYSKTSTAMSDALRGFTDEQILSTVKSRYIQSASDMRCYAESLSSEVRRILDSIASSVSSVESPEKESPVKESPVSES